LEKVAWREDMLENVPAADYIGGNGGRGRVHGRHEPDPPEEVDRAARRIISDSAVVAGRTELQQEIAVATANLQDGFAPERVRTDQPADQRTGIERNAGEL
jgi:hypothetical protein